MTSTEFKPEEQPKKRGRPPKKEAAAKLSPAEEARKRWEERKERESKSNTFEGDLLWVPQEFLDKYGLEYRWVLDDGRKLDQRLSIGYYFADMNTHPELKDVYSNDSDKNKISIGTNDKNGKPTRQYLMLRPLDIAEERKLQKREALRKRDQGLVSQNFNQGLGRERTSDGRSAAYVPNQGSSVFKPEG